MFRFLKNLLTPGGRQNPENLSRRLSSVPGSEAAEVSEPSAHDGTRQDFLCREAVIGRDQKIAGYELVHPQNLQSRLKEKRRTVRRFYDDALLRQLTALDLRAFLEGRLIFFELSPDSLAHPALT